MIPNYYGSYSLDIPISSSTKRRVRLILIELIPGSSMREIDPHELPQRARQEIMKSLIKFLKFETLAFSREISLVDVSPRNIMLIDSADNARAIFIDFGDVHFDWTKFWPEQIFGSLPSTNISPLLRWHEAHSPTNEFDGWVDWDWQPWLQTEFGHTAVRITSAMRGIFLPSD